MQAYLPLRAKPASWERRVLWAHPGATGRPGAATRAPPLASFISGAGRPRTEAVVRNAVARRARRAPRTCAAGARWLPLRALLAWKFISFSGLGKDNSKAAAMRLFPEALGAGLFCVVMNTPRRSCAREPADLRAAPQV